MTIFHITQRSAWESAIIAGCYIPQEFTKDGFIHCSTIEQVINVANRFYGNSKDLILLWISEEKLTAPLVYENLEGGEELFPHLYGELEIKAVSRVTPIIKDSDDQYIFPLNPEPT